MKSKWRINKVMKSNNEDLKTNEILLKKLLKTKNEQQIINILSNYPNLNQFKEYFQKNLKKSLFFARILPLVLFLITLLTSFSLLILSRNNENLKTIIYSNQLQYSILGLSCLLLILSICLFIQLVFMKTKVVYIHNGYNKGYCNIKKDKCLIIIKNIENNKV